MIPDETVETNWGQLASSILFQIAVGFGVGLVAAIAALLASGYFELSGFLFLSPAWLLPIAALALINLQRIGSAKAPLNVSLFLLAAFAAEIAVLFAITAMARS